MNKRFVISIVVVVIALWVLISAAVKESAKAVVTVEELSTTEGARKNIRLGAKVADGEIKYQTSPTYRLEFQVTGLQDVEHKVPVIFDGLRPDTFQVGRDVILEGSFDGKVFVAKTLLTQCPSKYVPPQASDTSGATKY